MPFWLFFVADFSALLVNTCGSPRNLKLWPRPKRIERLFIMKELKPMTVGATVANYIFWFIFGLFGYFTFILVFKPFHPQLMPQTQAQMFFMIGLLFVVLFAGLMSYMAVSGRNAAIKAQQQLAAKIEEERQKREEERQAKRYQKQ